MRRHSDGVTSGTSDSKNISGKIRKVINYNFDGIHDSLETICSRHYSIKGIGIKLTSTENLLPTLNNLQQNIKLTYELEQKRKIKF